MTNLLSDGVRKVLEGTTTIEEVLRVTRILKRENDLGSDNRSLLARLTFLVFRLRFRCGRRSIRYRRDNDDISRRFGCLRIGRGDVILKVLEVVAVPASFALKVMSLKPLAEGCVEQLM